MLWELLVDVYWRRERGPISISRRSRAGRRPTRAAKQFLDGFRLEDYMNTFHATLAPASAAATLNR
jgi:hypothetical protein